jgi:hypothetical protein
MLAVMSKVRNAQAISVIRLTPSDPAQGLPKASPAARPGKDPKYHALGQSA